MELVARENPALVLLDIWMPNIDGIELLRRIKAERPEVRVIMISGHGNIQNAVAATRLGAADFIEKPFSVSGLLTSIERVLERESRRRAHARREHRLTPRRRGRRRPRGSPGASSARSRARW